MKGRKILAAVFSAVIAFVVVYTMFTHKTRYYTAFYDVFDTYSEVTVYARSKKQADNAIKKLHTELLRLNQLYDIYNNYDGINNLKTVNDNAGKQPVVVDKDIMELLELSVKAYNETNGAVNPAMGSVLSLWHNARETAIENPQKARIPTLNELKKAGEHMDINCLVIDKEKGTVYISDSEASVDVGAIAKGYAADKAVESLKASGIENALINLGGNVVAVGTMPDGKEWGIGIRNPDEQGDSVAKISTSDGSVVTSGDYQRCFEVNGKIYNHIIDKNTLMPSERYRSVTIYAKNSVQADILSTALFVLPEKEGDEIAEKYGAKVCRIYPNGDIKGDKVFDID